MVRLQPNYHNQTVLIIYFVPVYFYMFASINIIRHYINSLLVFAFARQVHNRYIAQKSIFRALIFLYYLLIFLLTYLI